MANFACKFKFGDLLKEKITGFRGIVIKISFNVNGNTYYGLQKCDENNLNNLIFIPEFQLELIEEQKFHLNEY